MKLYHKLSKALYEAWQKEKSPLLLHYTGTMFGLGCDARDQIALQRIWELKQRRGGGFIVLLPDPESLKSYQPILSSRLAGLIRQYSPGSLTVVLKCETPHLEHLAIEGKIAFRIPEDEDLRGFLKAMDMPLVSTSINRSGRKAEVDYMKIIREYSNWFDLALVPDDELVAEGLPSTVVTEESGKLKCLREGKLSFGELEEDYENPLVTFMCTGNICRSPLAEYYFREQARKSGLKYRTVSAGFMDDGVSMSKHSLDLLAESGIDGSKHRSQQVTRKLMERSRLVLTMTASHKQTLLKSGWKNSNVFSLGEYVGKKNDVKDPYRQDREVYERVFQQIKYYVDLLVEKLSEEGI